MRKVILGRRAEVQFNVIKHHGSSELCFPHRLKFQMLMLSEFKHLRNTRFLKIGIQRWLEFAKMQYLQKCLNLQILQK